MHEKILSKKDVIKGWAKYFLCAEVSSGFERLTAPAFCFGMDPVLNKLYHDSPEEYKEALKRHLMFYNSEASWDLWFYGISCALEEERAQMLQAGAPQQALEDSAQLITNKVGLMEWWLAWEIQLTMVFETTFIIFIYSVSFRYVDCWCCAASYMGICITFFAYLMATKRVSIRKELCNQYFAVRNLKLNLLIVRVYLVSS